MRDEVYLGVERRRRWSDEAKLAILQEVGRSGWTVTDVARRHDITRQHIYQWRQQLKRRGLRSTEEAPVFLEVDASSMTSSARPLSASPDGQVRIVLRTGRELVCGVGIDDLSLRRLIGILEGP